jgi:SAM-dependent methyltransferase
VSDLSLNMLKSESNFSGKKICCDMISLPVKEKYDLVICAFDSINYLTSKIKIIKLFEEVKNLMHPNSFFVFDASMLSNSIKSSKNKITKGRVGSIHYSQQSTFNIKTRIHKNKFKIHYPDGNEFTETHRQKIYDFDFYFFAAEKSGLYVSECFDAFSFREAKYYNERVQFILRKNESNVNIR